MQQYFQLLEVFTLREIKYRYKASILGFSWIIIYPLVVAVMLNVVFGIFVKVPTENVPYFLFILSGFLFWNFFQQSIMYAKDSLIWNRDLVIKSSFQKNSLPLSYVLARIPDFFVNFIIFLIFFMASGRPLQLNFLYVFFLFIPLAFFAAGISLISSITNAIFRDFGRIVDLLFMIMFYISPIVYADSIIPQRYKAIILVNPLSLCIIVARNILFKNQFSIDLFILALVEGLIMFIIGFIFFKKMERKVADLI